MAQVALTPVPITSLSVVQTLVAATAGTYVGAAGNKFANTPTTRLTVKNGDASPHTMIISWTVDGVVVTRSQVIAAGVTRIFYFNPAVYSGTINIEFDAVTSVTVGVDYIA